MLFLYFCFLGIFFFLLIIILYFLSHNERMVGFIGFIICVFIFIIYLPITIPAKYRRFIDFSSFLSIFLYLDHKLKGCSEKEKKGKKKNK